MPAALFLEERRRAILDHVAHEGRVTVKTLSTLMQVSEVTIRQDLRALEEQGFIERTYGGAVYKGGAATSLRELSFNTRLAKRRAQKQAIAAAAAAYIQDGFSIAMDSSSSVYTLIPHLRHVNKLTIVTNGLMAAQSFLDHDERQIKVLITGGRLRNDSISTVGKPDELPDINLNIGVFSCHGLTPTIGASEIDRDETLMKQALMARCLHTIFLIDSSKWGRVAPYTVAASAEIPHIITDSAAPADQVGALRAQGVRVEVVDTD